MKQIQLQIHLDFFADVVDGEENEKLMTVLSDDIYERLNGLFDSLIKKKFKIVDYRKPQIYQV